MSKVFAVGRREDMLPFVAAGAELVEAADEAGVAAALAGIEHRHEPCLVMMDEGLARSCAAEVARFRSAKKRAVVAIPTLRSQPGLTLAGVRALVARSLGVDLLGRED